jgi:signal transduction histidine kinase
VQYSEPGDAIEVRCSADAARVYTHVSDTGVGIPADKLDSIFEPFIQVGRDYSTQKQGTGLGLAISRELARGMGGDLTATSQVGRGSTFTLWLPRAKAKSAAA